MKPIYFILTMLFLSCSSAGINNKPPEDIDGNNSKKIKKEIHTSYRYHPRDSCVGSMILYNEEERKIEEYDYSSCGELFKKVSFTYDEGGHIVKSHIESNIENVTYDWVYNTNGQLVEQVAEQPTASFQYRLSYYYDEHGNQVEYKGTMADGTAFEGTCRKVYKYQDGKKTQTVCYSGDNFDIKGYRIIHTYDGDGKPNGSLIYKDPASELADTTYISYEYF